jgi:hypothetical protein
MYEVTQEKNNKMINQPFLFIEICHTTEKG